LIVAGIYFKVMPETKPDRDAGKAPEGLAESFLGYFKVAKDGLFLVFTLAMIICTFPYQQIYSTLSVFLRDVHGIPESGFGYLVTANASVVVLFQFWVSSKVSKRKPLQMLALASFFYMIGLVMYGLFSTYALFMVAMLLITVGEMIMMPVSQAMVAKLAPEQMRGRYMAFFGLSWLVPSTFGPGAGGLILDNYNPNLIWYICGVFCLVAIGMFLLLNLRLTQRPPVPVPEGG
jgi:MFS family permease